MPYARDEDRSVPKPMVKVFRYTERGTPWWRNNTLAIQHIYPAGAIGLESPTEELTISRNTLDVRNGWFDGNGMNSFYPAAVRVGYDPEVILAKLTEMVNMRTMPNGFHKGNPHGIENCSIVPNTINEMVCMSHRGVLRLFPVWPQHKDARFANLRAWGAYGLLGALIVEPEGAVVTTDENTRASATVKVGREMFREFVVMLQDDGKNVSSAINYRTEPLTFRGNSNLDAINAAFMSNTLTANQPPQTPKFIAKVGQPVRFRILYPGGNGDNAFQVHGHQWQEEPYIDGSSRLGDNKLSQVPGTQQYMCNQAFNLLIGKAGGAKCVTGDYMYGTLQSESNGMWGYMTVCKSDAVRVHATTLVDGGLVVTGSVSVDPDACRFANKVTLYAGDTKLGVARIHRLPENRRLWGTWRFESKDARLKSADMIRVVSEPQTLGSKTFYGGVAQSRVKAAR